MWTIPFSVDYVAANDSFTFTFTSIYTPKAVNRVGFTYLDVVTPVSTKIETFYSEITTEYQNHDGISVAWDLCTFPVASSKLDLYNKILALYIPGGGGGGGGDDNPGVSFFTSTVTPGGGAAFPVDLTYTGPVVLPYYDTGDFNAGTGIFTCPVDGFYLVQYDMQVSLNPLELVAVYAIRNGSGASAFAYWVEVNTTGGVKVFNAVGSQSMLCNAGDLLELRCYSFTAPVTFTGTASIQQYAKTATGGVVQTVTGTAPIAVTGTSADRVVGLVASGIAAGTYTSLTVTDRGVATAGTNPAVVHTLGVTAPITNTGTASDPVIGHATSGSGAATRTFPQSITYNTTGHITAATAGAAPVASVSVTAPVVNTGTALNPNFGLAASGVAAGTYTSVTVTNKGVVTAGTNPASGASIDTTLDASMAFRLNSGDANVPLVNLFVGTDYTSATGTFTNNSATAHTYTVSGMIGCNVLANGPNETNMYLTIRALVAVDSTIDQYHIAYYPLLNNGAVDVSFTIPISFRIYLDPTETFQLVGSLQSDNGSSVDLGYVGGAFPAIAVGNNSTQLAVRILNL